MSLKSETIEWMKSLGFQDNTEAKYPNFIFSLQQFIEPDEDIKLITKENKDWDPLEEVNFSLTLAEYFYLKCKRAKEKTKEKVNIGNGRFSESDYISKENGYQCSLCGNYLDGFGWNAPWVLGDKELGCELDETFYPSQWFCSKYCLKKAQGGAELWSFDKNEDN